MLQMCKKATRVSEWMRQGHDQSLTWLYVAHALWLDQQGLAEAVVKVEVAQDPWVWLHAQQFKGHLAWWVLGQWLLRDQLLKARLPVCKAHHSAHRLPSLRPSLHNLHSQSLLLSLHPRRARMMTLGTWCRQKRRKRPQLHKSKTHHEIRHNRRWIRIVKRKSR